MLDQCRMFQALTNLCEILKKKKHDQYTFMPCMFRFPNSDHFTFSREFAFCLFINYAYGCTWMHVHKTTFEKKNKYSSLGFRHVVCYEKTKPQRKNVYNSGALSLPYYFN